MKKPSSLEANSNTIALRDQLTESFSRQELRHLCLDLGVDPEGIAGDTNAELATQIVLFFQRRGRLLELVEYCSIERPNLDWGNFIETKRNSAKIAKQRHAVRAVIILKELRQNLGRLFNLIGHLDRYVTRSTGKVSLTGLWPLNKLLGRLLGMFGHRRYVTRSTDNDTYFENELAVCVARTLTAIEMLNTVQIQLLLGDQNADGLERLTRDFSRYLSDSGLFRGYQRTIVENMMGKMRKRDFLSELSIADEEAKKALLSWSHDAIQRFWDGSDVELDHRGDYDPSMNMFCAGHNIGVLRMSDELWGLTKTLYDSCKWAADTYKFTYTRYAAHS